MRLAVFQPNIPGNFGSIFRTMACFGGAVDVIGPCGFPISEKALRRAGMDYTNHVEIRFHDDWAAFQAVPRWRLVLMTTRGATPLHAFRFEPGDTLLMGRESAGVPDDVHVAADARVVIPMRPGLRSLNVAVSAGIAAWAATPQLGSHSITDA